VVWYWCQFNKINLKDHDLIETVNVNISVVLNALAWSFSDTVLERIVHRFGLFRKHLHAIHKI